MSKSKTYSLAYLLEKYYPSMKLMRIGALDTRQSFILDLFCHSNLLNELRSGFLTNYACFWIYLLM